MKKFILIACILVLFIPSSASAVATWITPVDVTPDDADQWDDVDLSAHIASGSTGVILHFCTTNYSTYEFGFRKNGSSDERIQTIPSGKTHFWCSIGVDGSRIVELYCGSIDNQEVWLVGYYETDEVFFTNAEDISISTTTAWTDIDISALTGGDTAIGAFIEVVGVTNSTNWGLRKNGSSDDRGQDIGWHSFGVIGVDGSEILEGYVEDLTTDFFLVGYCKANTTFLTNATNLSFDTPLSEWTDLDALPAGATGGYIEADTGNYTHWGGLRENGSAEDIVYGWADRHAWGMVECDGSRLIEGYITNTSVDFFLTGYTESGAPPPPPTPEGEQSQIMIFGE